MKTNKALQRPLADFSIRDWAFLAVVIALAAFLGLGAHDLAIAHLGIPYPSADAVPPWARFFGLVVRVAAIVLTCRLAAWFLNQRSPWAAAAIVGLIILMLQETVRVLIIKIAIIDGFVQQRWFYEVIDAMPDAFNSLFIGGSAALTARFWQPYRRSVIGSITSVLIISAASMFLLLPNLHAAAMSLERALGLIEAPTVYEMPYNMHIYRFIYGMFLEPALATAFIAYLVWPSLPQTRSHRLAVFVLLVLFVRGRIVATGLFSFWVPQPTLLAFAAEAQFFLETFVTALIVGAGWMAVSRPDGSKSIV